MATLCFRPKQWVVCVAVTAALALLVAACSSQPQKTANGSDRKLTDTTTAQQPDQRNGQQIANKEIPIEGYPSFVKVTPDGKYVMVSTSKYFYIVDQESYEILGSVPGEMWGAVATKRDGQPVAFVFQEGTEWMNGFVVVVSLATANIGTVLQTITTVPPRNESMHTDPPITVSADGGTVYTYGRTGTQINDYTVGIGVIDVATGNATISTVNASFWQNNCTEAKSISGRPDGGLAFYGWGYDMHPTYCYTANPSASVINIDIAKPSPDIRTIPDDLPASGQLSPDGKKIYFYTEGQVMRAWHLETATVDDLDYSQGGSYRTFVLSLDGAQLFISWDVHKRQQQELYVFDIASGQNVKSFLYEGYGPLTVGQNPVNPKKLNVAYVSRLNEDVSKLVLQEM